MTVKTNTTTNTYSPDDTDDTARQAKATRRRAAQSHRQSREDTETFLSDLDDYLRASDNLSRFTISPKHFK